MIPLHKSGGDKLSAEEAVIVVNAVEDLIHRRFLIDLPLFKKRNHLFKHDQLLFLLNGDAGSAFCPRKRRQRTLFL